MGCPAHSTSQGCERSKGRRISAGNQFVGDGAIVDAMDGCQLPGGIAVVQFVANRLERGDVDHGYAKSLRT